MKSTLIKACASVLAIMMCAASFAACGKSEDKNDNTTTTPKVTTTTPAPETETTTEPVKEDDTTTTPKATEKDTTEATTPEESTGDDDEIAIPAEGLIVYYEDFNSYADSTDTEAVLKALGWTRLTKEANGVYNETDGQFAFEAGRLYYDNYDTAEETEALTAAGGVARSISDGYYAIDMLNDDYMKPVVMGKYTLQYDLEYVAAGNNARYAVLITECSADGQCYNSYHFRIGGYANNQCHFYGSWKTYDAFDAATDVYCASQATDAETAASSGTPVSFKLLGKYNDKTNDPYMFTNVKLTIKQQWDPEMGHTVYMKTAEMADFVKVSEPSVNADGIMYLGWDGWAVQFKFGSKIDGYMDNIIIWTGWGEQPVGTTVTYKPAA